MKVDENNYKNLIINNSQYFYLELNFTKTKPDYTKFVKPYFMYNGNSVRFTGNSIMNDTYGSIELPFGNYYKA